MTDAPAGTPTAATGAGGGTLVETMARVVVHPSEVVRPVPGFIFSSPRGWVLDEAPDAMVVVRTPEEVDGFWVNALLSHDRVPRSVDFKAAARITWARLQKQCPDAEVGFQRLARFGELITYLRGASMTAPRTDRRIAQLSALFFAPTDERGKTVDFFQWVCTCPEQHMDRFGPAFTELIGSFRFT